MIRTGNIRRHYDFLSVFYHLFWGEHIHHGYWYGSESARQAQINLIDLLSRRAGLAAQTRVLDVGCGMGGSALWLAENRGCIVKGITLSPVQAWIARLKSRRRGIKNAEFLVHDANDLGGIKEKFDCIWIIECSEHISKKKDLFRQCLRLLEPGGLLALCSWLRGSRADERPDILQEICSAMLCPPLLSGSELVECLKQAGFCSVDFESITPQVRRTWDHCIKIIHRKSVRIFLPVMSSSIRRFAESFELMKTAYEQDIMDYAMIVARKQ